MEFFYKILLRRLSQFMKSTGTTGPL